MGCLISLEVRGGWKPDEGGQRYSYKEMAPLSYLISAVRLQDLLNVFTTGLSRNLENMGENYLAGISRLVPPHEYRPGNGMEFLPKLWNEMGAGAPTYSRMYLDTSQAM